MFAFNQQQMQYQALQQQASLIRQQQIRSIISSATQPPQQMPLPMPIPRYSNSFTANCTTENIGNTAYTRCS